jgi:hypothetical protein
MIHLTMCVTTSSYAASDDGIRSEIWGGDNVVGMVMIWLDVLLWDLLEGLGEGGKIWDRINY